MSDPGMWQYVFSPRAIAIDAAAGLFAAVLFRIVRGHPPRTLKAWFAIALLTTVLRHTFPGTPNARSMPIGYVGHMVNLCMREASRDDCLCAADALKERIGEIATVQLGVKAEVNGTLPKEFVEALSSCAG